MPRKMILLTMTMGFFLLLAIPCLAQQQADLGNIGNTTVTLFYYDMTDRTKGAIVPMPDNPQYVNVDPALAAPGMYTFSQVPSGQWYYLEADHEGNKWYSVFYMEDNAGTKTANVNIPPMAPVKATATPTPAISGTPPTATTAPGSTPVPSHGMTAVAAGPILITLAALRAYRQK